MAYEQVTAHKRCLGQNYKIIPQKKKEKRRKEKRKGKKREKERKEKRKEKRKGKREEERKEKRKGRGEGGGGTGGEEDRGGAHPMPASQAEFGSAERCGMSVCHHHLLFIAFNLEPVTV